MAAFVLLCFKSITGILKYYQYSQACTLLQAHSDKLFMFNVFIMLMYKHSSKMKCIFSKSNIILYFSFFSLITNFEECPLHCLTGIGIYLATEASCALELIILLKSISVWFFGTKCS